MRKELRKRRDYIPSMTPHEYYADGLEMLTAVLSKNKHMQHTNYLSPNFEEFPRGDSGCESESDSESE